MFNDVLEHLLDPWSALRTAKTLLTPHGHVLASIPNVRHHSVLVPLVARGQWRYQDTGILDRTHLRFFTRASMVDLFTTTGFHVDRIEPVRVTSPRAGEIPRLLALLGRRGVEFRAKNYVVLASPCS